MKKKAVRHAISMYGEWQTVDTVKQEMRLSSRSAAVRFIINWYARVNGKVATSTAPSTAAPVAN